MSTPNRKYRVTPVSATVRQVKPYSHSSRIELEYDFEVPEDWDVVQVLDQHRSELSAKGYVVVLLRKADYSSRAGTISWPGPVADAGSGPLSERIWGPL